MKLVETPLDPSAFLLVESSSYSGGLDFPADSLLAAPIDTHAPDLPISENVSDDSMDDLTATATKAHPPDLPMSEIIDISDNSTADLPAWRIYMTNMPTRDLTPDWTPSRFLPSVRNPNYDREWMVYIIRPDLSSCYTLPDPVTWEDTNLLKAQWEHPVYHPVSPVPLFDGGPVPLYPVAPLSWLPSPAISDSEPEVNELRNIAPDEDWRFYVEMLGDNPLLGNLEPQPLDFDSDSEPGDNPDDNPGHNPGDNPANEDSDGLAGDDIGPELDDNAPVLHDDPGNEPDDPYAALGAAFE
ncbi:hypothetical protein FRC08_016720 [Ceratobasidium sp. 394]|nr:hypothetical protein FRC08_016720 [Ceratobasidium sp. 394]